MYQRDRFIFVSNLAKVTADPRNPITYRREAYLLSERYATPKRINLALQARKKKNLILSDNGNFTRMSKLAKPFTKAGFALLKSAKKKNGRPLPKTLLARRKALVKKITKACEQALDKQDKTKIISRQEKIKPHLMIGLEDFTIPVLSLCGLLEPEFQPRPKEVKKFQQNTLRLFTKQTQGDYGHAELLSQCEPICVLHAYDYNSAFQAGRALKNQSKIQSIAVSFGGAMASKHWIQEVQLGRKKLKLDNPLPEKYLLAQCLLMGVLNGIQRKVRVHILGTGSPILLVLIALFAPKTIAMSIDSSSPFKDADDGTLYGSRKAFLKMNMYKLAAFHLIHGTPYTNSDPFWKKFNAQYPSHWENLRKHLKVDATTDRAELAKTLKKNPKLLEKHIPFFMKARKGKDDLIEQLRISRSGSNYWVLRNICKKARALREKPSKLYQWVDHEIERYTKVASPKWAQATRFSYELAKQYGELI